MSATPATALTLQEYVPRLVSRERLSDAAGTLLWRHYADQVRVEFPSPITGGQWRLTSTGWVGYIPLEPHLGIALHPKVPLHDLFRMLEYAYDLRSFRLLDDQFDCQSLEELYERLAGILARKILDRARDGMYRDYVARTEQLPYIAGAVDVVRLARRPWDVQPECTYHEHTVDIDDNQILAWALFTITRSGLCTERTRASVRRAYRQLQSTVTLTPVRAGDCVGRRYHRLNADYAPLHALCRFFLEHSGPHYEAGEHTMLPFLVDMARLYEQFVVAWLRAHLPSNITLAAQERYEIDPSSGLAFAIDVVLSDSRSGAALCVLDTKYKRVDMPATADVAQVVAYAQAKHCRDSLLAYPQAPARPLDAIIGDVRVRSVTFALGDDLENAGASFLDQVLFSYSRALYP
ncbi:MAG: restriction endonuclease [Kouleothrix sp.]|nr:restriction endonuclease [Kouleothrix sp.]